MVRVISFEEINPFKHAPSCAKIRTSDVMLKYQLRHFRMSKKYKNRHFYICNLLINLPFVKNTEKHFPQDLQIL